MAKSPNVRGHKLKIGKPRNGQVSGSCSCGGWSGTGTTPAEIEQKWNDRHINKFDTLR